MRRHYEIEFTLKWTLCIVNWMLIIQHHEEILEIQCGFTSRNWGTNFDHHSAKLLSRLLIWCGSATAARHYSEIKVTFPIWCTTKTWFSRMNRDRNNGLIEKFHFLQLWTRTKILAPVDFFDSIKNKSMNTLRHRRSWFLVKKTI